MAVLTAKVEWRATTANKSPQRMLQLLRDFIVTTAGWTLLTDQIGAGASDAYFVVTKDRATGFSGDNPIIKIQYYFNAGAGYARFPQIFMTAYSAWSGTTGTNTTSVYHPFGYVGQTSLDNRHYFGANQVLAFSPIYDTDFYLSVDTTGKFILGTSKVVDYWNFTNSYGVVQSPIHGVACFERLTGDTSTGTFFGVVDSSRLLATGIYGNRNGFLATPLRWDGLTADSIDCHWNTGTRLGSGLSTLRNVNEAGKHVMLDIEVRRQDANKIKGKLFGIVQTTEQILFQHHTIFPTVAAPQYVLAKIPAAFETASPISMYTSPWNLAMQTGTTITTLS